MRPRKTFPPEIRAILRELRKWFKRAGWGSRSFVIKTLGLHSSYFSEKWSRPPATFDAGALLAILDVLGIDAATFFSGIKPASRTGELWNRPEPIAERATPTIRRAVQIACIRMREELGLSVGDVAGVDEIELPAAYGPTLGAEWLKGLDPHNLPEETISELQEHLHEIEAALLPQALALWGSALRTMITLEEAAYVNGQALYLAKAAGDEATIADLLQRRAHIMTDVMDYPWALTLTDLAAAIFDRIDDQAGWGRACVDQGNWLFYLGKPHKAIKRTERALELLPDSLPRSRFSAYLNLGHYYLEVGDLQSARDKADQAQEVSDVDPWLYSKLPWLKATICRKKGLLEEAEIHYGDAIKLLQDLHYGLTALAVLERTEVQLELGKPREAWQTCSALFRLLAPLQRDPILGAALVKLLGLGAQGLSLDVVTEARKTVERQSKRKSARARRVWRALAAGPSRAVRQAAHTVGLS